MDHAGDVKRRDDRLPASNATETRSLPAGVWRVCAALHKPRCHLLVDVGTLPRSPFLGRSLPPFASYTPLNHRILSTDQSSTLQSCRHLKSPPCKPQRSKIFDSGLCICPPWPLFSTRPSLLHGPTPTPALFTTTVHLNILRFDSEVLGPFRAHSDDFDLRLVLAICPSTASPSSPNCSARLMTSKQCCARIVRSSTRCTWALTDHFRLCKKPTVYPAPKARPTALTSSKTLPMLGTYARAALLGPRLDPFKRRSLNGAKLGHLLPSLPPLSPRD